MRRNVMIRMAALGAVAVSVLGACGSSSKTSSTKKTVSTAASRPTTSGSTTTAAATTAPSGPVDQKKPLGTNGLAVDGASIWVADWRGSQILRVDRATGKILARYGKTEGVTTSDDVIIGPDHAVYWSGLASGSVGRIGTDGKVSVVAHVDPSVNPITFSKDGTLYVGRTEVGTGLYQIDRSGKIAPKLIAAGWDTNAFAFGPDGSLYGPKKGMNGAGAVDRVDVKTGVITEVKTGFNYPVAVKFDKQGELLVLSTQGATLQKLDVKTGAVTDVAKPATAIVDNFALAPDGTIYISSFTQNILTVVKPDGTTSTITVGT